MGHVAYFLEAMGNCKAGTTWRISWTSAGIHMLWRGGQCTAGDKRTNLVRGTVPDPMIITGFALTLCDAGGTPALSRAMLSVDSAAWGCC
jgi:hypothetical protein